LVPELKNKNILDYLALGLGTQILQRIGAMVALSDVVLFRASKYNDKKISKKMPMTVTQLFKIKCVG